MRGCKAFREKAFVDAFGPMLLHQGKDPKKVARDVRRAMLGTVTPESVSVESEDWLMRRRIAGPAMHERLLRMFQDVLDGHGIESISLPLFQSTFTDEGVRMCPPVSYVNMGDLYVPTVVRNHMSNKWLIACLSDVIESLENKRK